MGAGRPMNRNWLLLGGLALVLVLGVYLVDHGRAPSSLGAAYTVRDAGAFWRLLGILGVLGPLRGSLGRRPPL
jgi:hypothetical protein